MAGCFLKKVVPFAAALVIGLFITNLFVTVAAPKFSFNRGYSFRHREARNLREENFRLRNQLNRQQERIAELEMRRTMELEQDFAPVEVPARRR